MVHLVVCFPKKQWYSGSSPIRGSYLDHLEFSCCYDQATKTQTAQPIEPTIHQGIPTENPKTLGKYPILVGKYCKIAGKYDLWNRIFGYVSYRFW